MGTVEKTGEDNERQRKILEAQSFSNEEKMEIQEVQLTEARTIAEEADRKHEEQARKLTFDCQNEESRAEFGERTVDKLESTIDYLQDNLYQEKLAFIEMSKKLDQTLNDMMTV